MNSKYSHFKDRLRERFDFSLSKKEIKFIETDDKNKALVFYGDEQTYRLIRQIIDDLDVSPPQVLLSARIVEASNKFSRDLGVALSRQAGDNKGNFSTKTVDICKWI
jgi:type II secretory pathway component GspD/PulD (secretin)